MDQNLNVIICGPSGSGKTTIINHLLTLDPKLKLSISYTTRDPRSGEIDGQEYYFISKDKFFELSNSDFFLETEEIFGNYYGTPKTTHSAITLFNLGFDGFFKMKELNVKLISIFIISPDLNELKCRLSKRDLHLERFTNIQEQLAYFYHFDYCVINDQLETAVIQIYQIIDINYKNCITRDLISKMICKYQEIDL